MILHIITIQVIFAIKCYRQGMHALRVARHLESLDNRFVEETSSLLFKNVFKGNSSLFLCGNGGSNAIATHLATDLHKIGFDNGLSPKIFNLGSGLSLVTAIANDYNFEEIFCKELDNLGCRDDLLISISSSGQSRNIIRAIHSAKHLGMTVITLNGFKDPLATLYSNLSLNLNLEKGDYELAEDLHAVICHSISLEIKKFLN